MLTIIRWSAMGVALLGAALGVAVLRDSTRPVRAEQAPSPPAPVSTVKLGETSLVLERSYLGEVWAASEAALSASEAGRVRKVHVVEGTRVKKGQLLVELDDSLAQARLRQAFASRKRTQVEQEYAEREARRFANLAEAQVATVNEAEQLEGEAQTLEAQAARDRADMQVERETVLRHRIVAPFDGVVANRHVDPGDWLDPGAAAVELLTDERLEILVRVPEDLLIGLDRVKAVALVRGDQRVAARLAGQVPALDRATRTALLRLEPDETSRWLLPGSTTSVVFRVEETGGFVVPRDGLVHGVADVRIVTVNDGKAAHVPVKVLGEAGNQALVAAEQLKPGLPVIVRGNERLRPDQPVAPEPLADADAKASSKQ